MDMNMYGKVEKIKVLGLRGEAVALLAEYHEAKAKAMTTYDMSTEHFLPEDWFIRLRYFLKNEGIVK